MRICLPRRQQHDVQSAPLAGPSVELPYVLLPEQRPLHVHTEPEFDCQLLGWRHGFRHHHGVFHREAGAQPGLEVLDRKHQLRSGRVNAPALRRGFGSSPVAGFQRRTKVSPLLRLLLQNPAGAVDLPPVVRRHGRQHEPVLLDGPHRRVDGRVAGTTAVLVVKSGVAVVAKRFDNRGGRDKRLRACFNYILPPRSRDLTSSSGASGDYPLENTTP